MAWTITEATDNTWSALDPGSTVLVSAWPTTTGDLHMIVVVTRYAVTLTPIGTDWDTVASAPGVLVLSTPDPVWATPFYELEIGFTGADDGGARISAFTLEGSGAAVPTVWTASNADGGTSVDVDPESTTPISGPGVFDPAALTLQVVRAGPDEGPGVVTSFPGWQLQGLTQGGFSGTPGTGYAIAMEADPAAVGDRAALAGVASPATPDDQSNIVIVQLDAAPPVEPTPPAARVELGLTPTTAGSFIIGTSDIGSTDVLGGDLGYQWTDVTEWVVEDSLRFRRGAARTPGPWWRAEVGTAGFTLDNNETSDQFNPLNTAGPYYGNLRPGIPVRIFWSYNDGSTDLQWLGRVDRWDPVNQRDLYGEVSVTATDGIERLQAANLAALPVAEGAGDTAGARINRILDRVGWPTVARDIDTSTGGATMQATTMAQPAWTDILLTADSDGGLCWIDRRGRLAFRRRTSLPTGPQLTFTADGTGLDYADVALSYDRTQVINIWKLARVGGTEQVVENPASSADTADGPRGFQRSDLICETDTQVGSLAAWQLYQFGRLKFRIEAVVVRLLEDVHSDAVWQQIVRADIGDRIRVVHPVPNGGVIDQQSLIRGVEWRPLRRGSEITFSLQIVPTQNANPFIVGASAIGGTDVLTPY